MLKRFESPSRPWHLNLQNIMTVVAPHLTTLPTEILLVIVEHLSVHEMVQLARTCRALIPLGRSIIIAKALMRSGTAEDAIIKMEYRFNRMDIVVELFRHADDRKDTYPYVASIAARLNDLEQLQAWLDEFGFISSYALIGAALSRRIDTFGFIIQHVEIDAEEAFFLFEIIGGESNRTLLEYLRSERPDLVTLRNLEEVVETSARKRQLDFSIEVFRSMPSDCDETVNSAFFIANAAVQVGDLAIFTEFIDLYSFMECWRSGMYDAAARRNRVDLMRAQEHSKNAPDSPGEALPCAVRRNAIDSFHHILCFDNQALKCSELESAFRTAISQRRSEMAQILMPRVSGDALLEGGLVSHSFDEAVSLIRHYQTHDETQTSYDDWDIDIFGVTDDADWKVTITLVIAAIRSAYTSMKYALSESELSRCLSALPAAIDLARELGVSGSSIDNMVRFVRTSEPSLITDD